MSIKQNGGVFGRNPTFNDVTIEGQLTFDGDIDINSDLDIDGDLTVDGVVGIKTTSVANGDLQIGDGNSAFSIALAGPRAKLGYDGANVIVQGGVTKGIAFCVNNGTLGSGEAARFNTSGNLAFVSGNGIDFSATSGTGTSELLDDYEEGVFTPTYVPQTGSFTSITYNSQLGKYTKVGDTVYAFFDLNVVVDPTGASGTVSIGGLPFSGLQTACFGGIGAARRFATSFTFGGLQTSGTAIIPYKTDTSNLNLVPLNVTDLATGGARNLITAGVTYKVS